MHKAPHFGFVLALNLPWLLLPLGTLIRMAREHPFTELAPKSWTGKDLQLVGFELSAPAAKKVWLELDNVRFYQ